MRPAITALLVVLTLAIAGPLVSAEPSAGTLLGQLVDAGGRGSVGRSVELVRDGSVISNTVTTGAGEFVFSGIAPGSYVVRTTVNNQVAGTKIVVGAGQSLPVTVVLPSLSTASPVIGPTTNLLLTFVQGLANVSASRVYQQAIANNDIVFVENVPFSLYTTFVNDLSSQLQFTANNIARAIHIGPYSTN